MNSLYNKFRYFNPPVLVYLIPPSLITGPFLPDLLLTITGIIFLIKIAYEKKLFYYNNLFTKIFLLFYSIIILSSLLSGDILFSLESSLFYFRYLFFCIAIYYCIEKYYNFLKRVFQSFLITCIFVIFDSYFQWYFGYNILGWNIHTQTRLTSFFGEEMILGSFFSRIIPIMFMCYIIYKKNINNRDIIFILGFTLLVIALVFRSGERAALGYVLIFFIYLLFIFKKNIIITLTSFILLISLSLSIILFNQTVKERMVDNTFNQISDDTKIFTISKYLPYSEHHELHYITALKMFLDKPFLGHGPKLFRKKCSIEDYYIEYGCSTHPHNTYVQLLAETGIIGFIFILSIFIFCLYHFFKKLFFYKGINKYYSILYIPLLLTLFPLFPTGSFFNNWLNVLYYFPLGIMIWKLNELAKEKDLYEKKT